MWNVTKAIFIVIINEDQRDLPSHLMRQEDLTVRIAKGLLGEVVAKGVNTRLLQKQHLKLK